MDFLFALTTVVGNPIMLGFGIVGLAGLQAAPDLGALEGVLKGFLYALCLTGGGGAVYEIIEEIPALARLAPRYKRLAAFGLSAVLGWLGYIAILYFGWEPTPETVRDWLVALGNIAVYLFTVSQAIHAKDLATK